MKYTTILLSLLISSCSSISEKGISKQWLGKPVKFSRIQESVNIYHMFDSTGTKIGSMDFGWSFEDGMLVSRDTSQFDDGSVYETAVFEFDTADFTMSAVFIDMSMGPTTLDVDVLHEDGKIQGRATMRRDTLSRQNLVDSVYGLDAFREELYMLMHAVDYEPGDSLVLDVFVPTGFGISRAVIKYIGQDQVEVPAGNFECIVILLQSSGGMPTNKIWISNVEPKKIVKFYVPGPELTIELIKSQF
ncbi:hypothetical protein [Ekhidna sp.]|uniref:hypothetical protein n=1 Tax=Ekhidna sp. TaxID=2608089 RepID=UPI0032979344